MFAHISNTQATGMSTRICSHLFRMALTVLLLNGFSIFLKSRKFRVRVNDSFSEKLRLTLLFNFFTLGRYH